MLTICSVKTLLVRWPRVDEITDHNDVYEDIGLLKCEPVKIELKGPDILSNEIKERTDMMSFRTNSGRNEVCFEFVSAVRNSSPKQTFW